MRRSALVTGCACAALAIAGCGDQEVGSSGAELASLAPAGAPIYVEAVIRPEGDQREEIEASLGTLLGTDDVGGMLIEAVEEEAKSSDSAPTFSEDVLPWLGQRAAFFFTSFGDGAKLTEQGAFIVETTDAEAALATVEELNAASDSERMVERSYRGTDYFAEPDSDPAAAGIVGEHLVVGSESGVRVVIDIVEGGESLADSTELPAEFDQLGSEAVAAFYADPTSVLDALETSGQLPADQRETVEAQIGIGIEEPVAGSLGATASSFFLEFSSAPGEASTEAAPELLAELPADSWFAAAAGNFGAALDAGIAGFDAQLEAAPVVPPELRGGLEAAAERELGLDVRELASSIGDVAFYLSGTSIFGLGGALIVETSDEAATLEALEPLREALERDPSVEVQPLDIEGEGFEVAIAGAPVQIPIVLRDGRLVAGLGTESVEEAFEPDESLPDSGAFAAAAEELGGDLEPTFFFDFEPLVELIESTGQTYGDAGYAEAKPYLDALDFFAFGQALEDGRLRVRVSMGVDEASE